MSIIFNLKAYKL